jgi:hypothetical protein
VHARSDSRRTPQVGRTSAIIVAASSPRLFVRSKLPLLARLPASLPFTLEARPPPLRGGTAQRRERHANTS